VGRRRLIVVAALAAVGCGPTPPQAPGPEAHRLNESLSTFSTACGHAIEVQTFSRDTRALRALERQALAQVPTVVTIYKRNPQWIFQGKTVAELVRLSVSYLDECGLHRAASRLRAATSER
jgi:hypothetical protein